MARFVVLITVLAVTYFISLTCLQHKVLVKSRIKDFILVPIIIGITEVITLRLFDKTIVGVEGSILVGVIAILSIKYNSEISDGKTVSAWLFAYIYALTVNLISNALAASIFIGSSQWHVFILR